MRGTRKSADSHTSVSLATRYLCAAPHLRGGMLPLRTAGQGRVGARLRPVGRPYAVNVLFSAEGAVPMSAVDITEVRRHCRMALLQTIIRDVAMVAVVIASAVLEPQGTAIVFGLAIAVIMIMGRVRLFSLWTAAAIIAVAVVLFIGIYRGQVSFAIPLACLAACFIIFMADILLSLYRLRRLQRMPPPQQHPDSDDQGEGKTSSDKEERGHKNVPAKIPSKVYHDDLRFIGTGIPLKPLEIFVMLDKPLDADKEITEFTISQLLTYIGLHLLSQGVSGGQASGYAHGPLSAENDELSFQAPVHFTEGFPYLSVMPVTAVCVPESRKHLVFRVRTLRLNYHDTRAAADILAAADRSQSQNGERYYVRASTSSLDGQVVISVYIHVTLQGHALTIVMWPHILAPVVADLRVADRLAAESPIILTFKAAAMTARQFGTAARRIHDLSIKPRESGGADDPAPGLYSTRERYAQPRLENMNRAMDSSRIIQIMVKKITRVTKDYLVRCNIDTEDYERQVNVMQSYTVIGDAAIFSGTFKDSTVTANMNGNGAGSSNNANPS